MEWVEGVSQALCLKYLDDIYKRILKRLSRLTIVDLERVLAYLENNF